LPECQNFGRSARVKEEALFRADLIFIVENNPL
jgi:hypothetical protein